jgi:hypothetical protein
MAKRAPIDRLPVWRSLLRQMLINPTRANPDKGMFILYECELNTETHLILQELESIGAVYLQSKDISTAKRYYVLTARGCQLAGYSYVFAAELERKWLEKVGTRNVL